VNTAAETIRPPQTTQQCVINMTDTVGSRWIISFIWGLISAYISVFSLRRYFLMSMCQMSFVCLLCASFRSTDAAIWVIQINKGALLRLPLFVKMVDSIVLSRYYDLLVTSELQFGFKPDHSTCMCICVLHFPGC
jgi:hypothetical protein